MSRQSVFVRSRDAAPAVTRVAGEVAAGVSTRWVVYVHLGFDEHYFVAMRRNAEEAAAVAERVELALRRETGREILVRTQQVTPDVVRKHGLAERVRAAETRAARGLMTVEAVAARHAMSAGPAAAEAAARTGDDAGDEYWPAAAFPKGMAARLRMAARRGRKTKRVATRLVDGVVCYSVRDARRWWPTEVVVPNASVTHDHTMRKPATT